MAVHVIYGHFTYDSAYMQLRIGQILWIVFCNLQLSLVLFYVNLLFASKFFGGHKLSPTNNEGKL
jgi:hypothetical protein